MAARGRLDGVFSLREMGELEVFCQETERSRLWGGRMCWRRANANCDLCGKPICPAHSRFLDEEHRACVTCELERPARGSG